MLGSGIFINTALLTSLAGSLGATVYLIVGILLLPLILAIAQLIRHHRASSTFYHFGLSISPFFGFISSWSYFIAKLASCGLGIHVCISFLQSIIPLLAAFPTLVLDSIILACFTLLNLLHLKTGKAIQYSFIVLKLVPILCLILFSLYLFSPAHFGSDTLIFSGIPLSIPLVLYAFSGFEASCSLSTCLENPEKNGPRAILYSYGIVIAIAALYQFCFFGNLGVTLGTLANGYLGAFPALLSTLFSSASPLKPTLTTIIHICIASSSLGAAYGIMYSNSWNLYTLAENNHLWGKKLFTKLNAHSVPMACVIIEGFLACAYLLITQGSQVPLQQVAALGSTIAYTCSSIALLILIYRKYKKVTLIPILSLISCGLLIGSFIWSIVLKGISFFLLVYITMLALGTFMFFKKHEPSNTLKVFEEI